MQEGLFNMAHLDIDDLKTTEHDDQSSNKMSESRSDNGEVEDGEIDDEEGIITETTQIKEKENVFKSENVSSDNNDKSHKKDKRSKKKRKYPKKSHHHHHGHHSDKEEQDDEIGGKRRRSGRDQIKYTDPDAVEGEADDAMMGIYAAKYTTKGKSDRSPVYYGSDHVSEVYGHSRSRSRSPSKSPYQQSPRKGKRLLDLVSDEEIDLHVAAREKEDTFRPYNDPQEQRLRDQRKKSRRVRKSTDYFARKKQKEAQNHREREPTGPPICRYFKTGHCSRADNCQYSHDFDVPKKMELCKFYAVKQCLKGDNCTYLHHEFPCKFYHDSSVKFCRFGDTCKFSHDPLTSATKPLLERFISERPFPLDGEDEHEELSYSYKDDKKPSLLGSPPTQGNAKRHNECYEEEEYHNSLDYGENNYENQRRTPPSESRSNNPFELPPPALGAPIRPNPALGAPIRPHFNNMQSNNGTNGCPPHQMTVCPPNMGMNQMGPMRPHNLGPMGPGGPRNNANMFRPNGPIRGPPPGVGPNSNFPPQFNPSRPPPRPGLLIPPGGQSRGPLITGPPPNFGNSRFVPPSMHMPPPGMGGRPPQQQPPPLMMCPQRPPPSMLQPPIVPDADEFMNSQLDIMAQLVMTGKQEAQKLQAAAAQGSTGESKLGVPSDGEVPSTEDIPPGAYVPKNSLDAPSVRLGTPSTPTQESNSAAHSLFSPSNVQHTSPSLIKSPGIAITSPNTITSPVTSVMNPLATTPASPTLYSSGNKELVWRLLPLDAPVKIPYPLMQLPADVPHLHNDPRLKGHAGVLRPKEPRRLSNSSGGASDVGGNTPSSATQKRSPSMNSPPIGRIGSESPFSVHPPSLPSALIEKPPPLKEFRIEATLKSESVSATSPQFSGFIPTPSSSTDLGDGGVVFPTITPVSRPFQMQLNEMSSTFVKQEANSSQQQGNLKTYLSDPRFKRRKAVTTELSSEQTESVEPVQ